MKNGIYWWHEPYKLLLFFLIPFYLICSFSLLGESQLIERLHFNYYYFFIGLVFLLTIVVSSSSLKFVRNTQKRRYIHPLCIDLLFVLCVIGYTAFLYNIITDRVLITNILIGNITGNAAKDLVNNVPGISTFTQAGIAFVILYYYKYLREKAPIRYRYYFFLLWILTIFRSILLSERLALIEIAVPIVLFQTKKLYDTKFKYIKLAINGAPYIGTIALYIFFMIAEYSRSWLSFYINKYDTIYEFAADRLNLYYTTALNNGVGMLEKIDWGTFEGRFTFKWLYNFPLIGNHLSKSILSDQGKYRRYLHQYSDLEFNNPSGIYVYFYDWGWAALIVAIILGFLCSLCIDSWKKEEGLFFCLFPIVFIHLLEIIRIPYLFGGRAILPIGLIVLIFIFSRTTKIYEKNIY